MPAIVRTISDQLRDSIRDSGLSVRELGKRADVDAGMIHRFLADERGLTTPSVDRLAEALGLRLAEARGRARARPATRRAG
jgi:plasmid maintenance system antidote protein VapI